MVSKLPLLAFLVTVFVSQLCFSPAVNAGIYFGLFSPHLKNEKGYLTFTSYEKRNKTIILMWGVKRGRKPQSNVNLDQEGVTIQPPAGHIRPAKVTFLALN